MTLTRERIEEIARRCGEAIRTGIGHWQYKDGGVSFDNIGALCALALKGLDAGEGKTVAWDADGVEIATSSAYHEGYETGRKSALAASTSPADGAVEALADCIALLDALAESALKDDDTATWAMCSVMADKHRPSHRHPQWRHAMTISDEKICPFCGAYSTRSCELEEETGGMCPWEEVLEDEPDPDLLREDRDERRRLFAEDNYD